MTDRDDRPFGVVGQRLWPATHAITVTHDLGHHLLRLGDVVGCFFQAEDGIRDLTVTGVQTCALPIWRRIRPAWRARMRRRAPSVRARLTLWHAGVLALVICLFSAGALLVVRARFDRLFEEDRKSVV